MLTNRMWNEDWRIRVELPGKSDSNLMFAGSLLVSGREQRPLLPELRLSMPELSLSRA
jgi:hypothetical protein